MAVYDHSEISFFQSLKDVVMASNFLVLSAVLIFGDIWQMALAYSGAAWRANKTYSFKHNCQTAGVDENKTVCRPRNIKVNKHHNTTF